MDDVDLLLRYLGRGPGTGQYGLIKDTAGRQLRTIKHDCSLLWPVVEEKLRELRRDAIAEGETVKNPATGHG